MLPTTLNYSRWIYSLALFVAAIAIIVAVFIGAVEFRDLALPLVSIFGTFFGATFAFRLNEEKEARKLREVRREVLNRALFVLIRQTNAMHQLTRDFEKFPSPFEKAFNFPALTPPPYGDLIHNLSDLEFLLESSTPGLLMEIAIEQERFHQALDSLRIRNEFYVGEVQPALDKLALNGKQVTAGEAARLLGERLFGGAMNGAETAWQHISSCNVTIPALHKSLLHQAKVLYPGHKFITYEQAT
jgi:hypothetical protein